MNKDIIKNRLMEQFNSIYVDVVGHDSEGCEYDVLCFGVDETTYQEITSAIHDIEDELFSCGTISLSAIVFTAEETEAYYPEMALCLKDVLDGVNAVSHYPLLGQADLLRRLMRAPAKCYFSPRLVRDFSAVSAAPLKKYDRPADVQAADESYALAA